MDFFIRFLRTAGLLAAVLVLPCCRDQVGKGDEEAQITVRASLNLANMEPNNGCFEPAISSNGRWVVFASASNTITPNDNNGRRDIFLKDRQSGEIFNLTDPFVFPFTPQLAPDDCFDPTVSDDGNFIAFRSKGAWDPYFSPAIVMPNDGVFRINRSSGTIVYERAFDAPFEPDAGMFQPTISADGQKVAFMSASTDMTPVNPGGLTQIYVYDFNTLTMRIVTKQEGAVTNTPCNGNCNNPRISAGGNFVVFESHSTNLDAGTAALPKPQVYRGASLGTTDVLPVASNSSNVLTDEVSFMANISADGTYVLFHSTDQQLLNPPATTFDFLIRKNLGTGLTELVTDEPGGLPFPIFPNGYIPSLSDDGRMVAFNSRDSALAGGITLNRQQVFVRDMVTGKVFFCSRHKDGTPSNLDVDAPRISGDGKWVIWSTVGSTLVDGDTNGFSDIFLHGPLR